MTDAAVERLIADRRTVMDERLALDGIVELASGPLTSGEQFKAFGHTPQSLYSWASERGLMDWHLLSSQQIAAAHPLPADAPDIGLYVTAPVSGVALPYIRGGTASQIVDFYPFITNGVEHRFRLRRVLLDTRGGSALLDGSIGGVPIAFRDYEFPVSRVFHFKGVRHNVVLSAIAYDVSLVEGTGSFQLDVSQWSPERRAVLDVDVAETLEVNVGGMAALMPIEDMPPHNVRLQGPVIRTAPYYGPLPCDGAQLVTVLVARHCDVLNEDGTALRRIDGEDDGAFALALLVTPHALSGGPMPKVGDHVSAVAFLQGRVWRANVKRTPLEEELDDDVD